MARRWGLLGASTPLTRRRNQGHGGPWNNASKDPSDPVRHQNRPRLGRRRSCLSKCRFVNHRQNVDNVNSLLDCQMSESEDCSDMQCRCSNTSCGRMITLTDRADGICFDLERFLRRFGPGESNVYNYTFQNQSFESTGQSPASTATRPVEQKA